MSKSANEVIDENVWCMCFVIFKEDTLEGTGVEWLPCPCSLNSFTVNYAVLSTIFMMQSSAQFS